MKTGTFVIAATLAGMWLGAAQAASLASTHPAQPIPAAGFDAAPAPAETWSTGSARLVPFMAAETQAHATEFTAPAAQGAGGAGKAVDDVGFVKQATESGRREVRAAREALPQLRNAELKRIAEMLVKDHSAAGERLSRIAEGKGWPVPAPQAAPPPPAGTASSDFDARWTADMIAAHERSVALYRAQAERGDDRELRAYARETLPTIEHHLEELRSLQK